MCMSSDHQFGFKTKHSTDMCVFLLKQAVSFYNKHDTPVYATFLDASKGFCTHTRRRLFYNVGDVMSATEAAINAHLTYDNTLCDAVRVADRHRIVSNLGNSLVTSAMRHVC